MACAVLGVLGLAGGVDVLVPACFGLSAAALVWSRFLNPAWSSRRERMTVAAAAAFGTAFGLAVSALPDDFEPANVQDAVGVAFGVAVVPLAAWASNERRWDPPDLLRRAGIRVRWSLLGVVPMLAVPCAAYALAWLRLPDANTADALRYAFVGVLVWPVATAAVRDELLRSTLWPPWWAASQVTFGVPITAAIALQRSADRPLPAMAGVVATGLLLGPVVLWVHRHAQRRSPGHLPRIGTILSIAEALAPAFDPAIRYRILAYVARHRFNIGRAAIGHVDEASAPTVERALSTWFAFLDTWSLSRRQLAFLAIELGTLVGFLCVPPALVLARTDPALPAEVWWSALVLYASILALGALGRGRRNSPGRWTRLVAVLILLESLGVYAGVVWGARNENLQQAFAAAITMAGGALLALAARWALLSAVPVRVRDWTTVRKPVALSGSAALTAMYAALLAELSWLREPWSFPVMRRDLAARLLHLADWCERRLRILCPSAPDARTAATEGAEALRTLRPWVRTMKNRTDYDRVHAEVEKLVAQAAFRAPAQSGDATANPTGSVAASVSRGQP